MSRRNVHGEAVSPRGLGAKIRYCLTCVSKKARDCVRRRKRNARPDDAVTPALDSKLVMRNVNASEAEDALAASQLDLRELEIHDSEIRPEFLSRLETKTELQTLEMGRLNGVQNETLDFLYPLQKLKKLSIDDVSLTDRELTPIFSLRSLGEVKLGISDVSKLNPNFLTDCSARLSLNIYGSPDDSAGAMLQTSSNLVAVSFENFGTMEFPSWIPLLTTLETLSLSSGRLGNLSDDLDVLFLSNMGEDLEFAFSSRLPHTPENLFPSSLRRFSCTGCHVDQSTLKNIFYSGHCLTELELSLDGISGSLSLVNCTNLRVLKLHSKECDAEMLMYVGQLQHLTELHFSGCLGLGARQIANLHGIEELQVMGISNSSITEDACYELGFLGSLKHLTFRSCFGIQLSALASLNGLESVKLINCYGIETQMELFLETALIQSLDNLTVIDEGMK